MTFKEFEAAVIPGDYIQCNWNGDLYYFTFAKFGRAGYAVSTDEGFIVMENMLNGKLYPKFEAGVGSFSSEATFKIIERNGICIS